MEVQICSVCQKPKQSAQTGSFTQWFAVCKCDEIEEDNQSIVLCAKCGKSIDRIETGSFTEWVLKKNSCQCENPVYLPVSPTQMTMATQKAGEISEVKEASFFDIESLNADTFPLHRYKPVKRLGFGGAGTVFLCQDTHLRKNVAVKVLRRTTDENAINFQNEARVMAKLEHSNLTSILDLGITESGSPYMVLEYMDGTSLERVLSRTGTLEESTARELFIQIADALKHVHSAGIYHRDIKSSNILVIQKEDGSLKASIIDFGIAFLYSGEQGETAQGLTIVGTPKYMPPDQIQGTKFDARSEIYSLGCLMYEVLTGRLPFESEDALSILDKHSYSKVPSFYEVDSNLAIDPKFEKLVMKCLEKKPQNRFQSMEKLIEALQDINTSRYRTAQKTMTMTLAKKQSLLIPAVLALAVLIICGVLFIGIFGLHDNSSSVKTEEHLDNAPIPTDRGIMKFDFHSAFLGDTEAFIARDRARFDWSGMMSLYLIPPNFEQFYITYILTPDWGEVKEIKEFFKERWKRDIELEVSDVKFIEETELNNLPCKRYTCKIDGIDTTFWATESVQVDRLLSNSCAKIVGVPPGYGLPMKAVKTYTEKQIEALDVSKTSGLYQHLNDSKNDRTTVDWLYVRAVKKLDDNEDHSYLFRQLEEFLQKWK